MARKRNNFTITRNPKPLTIEIVSTVLISDIMFVLFTLLMVALRNVIGLDVTLVVFLLVVFAVKSLFTVYAVFKMVRGWLGVTYYVLDNQLIIQSNIKRADSSVRSLDELSNVVAKQTYIGRSKQNYGNLVLEFATGATSEKVMLSGVDTPEAVAKRLLDQAKNVK